MTDGVWHCHDRPVGDQQVDGPCGEHCSALLFEKDGDEFTRASGDLEPIHGWFGLSYSNYLVLQRSILQSMPEEWQRRFVSCLEDLQEASEDLPVPSEYAVFVRKENGRFGYDEIPNYNKGRTKLDLKVKAPCLTEGESIATSTG